MFHTKHRHATRKHSIPRTMDHAVANAVDMPAAGLQSDPIRNSLIRLLNAMGFPAHLKGYEYWIYALQLTVKDTSLLNRLTTALYPMIAEHFHVSALSVEHNLRTVLSITWDRGRPEEANRLLGRNVNMHFERPTNGEMLALLTDKLRITMSRMQMLEQYTKKHPSSRRRRRHRF